MRHVPASLKLLNHEDATALHLVALSDNVEMVNLFVQQVSFYNVEMLVHIYCRWEHFCLNIFTTFNFCCSSPPMKIKYSDNFTSLVASAGLKCARYTCTCILSQTSEQHVWRTNVEGICAFVATTLTRRPGRLLSFFNIFWWLNFVLEIFFRWV